MEHDLKGVMENMKQPYAQINNHFIPLSDARHMEKFGSQNVQAYGDLVHGAWSEACPGEYESAIYPKWGQTFRASAIIEA